MSFIITTSDITTEKVDVIVNSLGIVPSHYGGVCQAIIDASKGDELKKIIDGKDGKVKIGDIFITDSFGLPAKKILHLVTPFYKYDKEYTAFETAIRDVLNLCRNSGFKSVSIPIIGTVGNGYNPIEIQNILMAMCAGFAYTYKEMEIRVVKKPIGIKDFHGIDLDMDEIHKGIHRDIKAFESAMESYYRDRRLKPIREERDYDAKFFESVEPITPVKWKIDGYDPHRPDVVFSNEERMKYDIDDYIKEYVKRRYKSCFAYEDREIRKEINIYVGNGDANQGSKYYYGIAYGESKVPNRLKMFKIALALGMSDKEATEFLSTFGIYPSIRFPAEVCIMDCIHNGIYNMNSIDEELRKRKIATLFE